MTERSSVTHQTGLISDDPSAPALQSYALKTGIDSIPDLLVAARIARGMTQKDLADYMGLKMQQIQAYESDRYQGASLSRIAWVAKALNLDIQASGGLLGDRDISDFDLDDCESFPVGEMYRRGWLGPQEGGVKHLQRNSKRLLSSFFDRPGLAHRRRYARTKQTPHEAALVAWETQLLRSACSQAHSPRFDRNLLSAGWVKGLVGLSSKRDGLKRIPQYLQSAGITLVIESALPGMTIDAAVIRDGERTMVIGLTLRNPREVEFWPALLHAIAHARLHVSLGDWDTIFHENGTPASEPFQEDADVFAREALVPSSGWAKCTSRSKPTAATIVEDAHLLGVGIAVVVGRCKSELGSLFVLRVPSANRDVAKAMSGE